jgi:hypothetical protein
MRRQQGVGPSARGAGDETALQLLHGCCEELMGRKKKQQLRGVRSKLL